jgi:hypothetical protein
VNPQSHENIERAQARFAEYLEALDTEAPISIEQLVAGHVGRM